MKISTKIRYGTRAMVHLAMAYPERPVTVNEMAKGQHLPIKYLEQIMAPLKAAGLIKGVRGKHGGYSLAKRPEVVRLMDIFEALEGSLLPLDCCEDPSACPMQEECVTRKIWMQMEEALEKVLIRTTIHDLVEEKREKTDSVMPMYYI